MHSIGRVIKPRAATAGKKVPSTRPAHRRAEHGETRSALLDAAEALLLAEGYAAVTSRRIGERAGANSALIHYYFESMDGLFVELFRRGAERGLERQATALHSPQPLWALWDVLHDQINNVRTVESCGDPGSPARTCSAVTSPSRQITSMIWASRSVRGSSLRRVTAVTFR